MASVTGPIASLPGSYHDIPLGARCDNHDDRLAIRRVQGETDSFGAEMHDLCQECLDEIKKHLKSAQEGRCDWCKKNANDLKDTRDYDEGICGPVYQVCGPCRKRRREEDMEYLKSSDGYDW